MKIAYSIQRIFNKNKNNKMIIKAIIIIMIIYNGIFSRKIKKNRIVIKIALKNKNLVIKKKKALNFWKTLVINFIKRKVCKKFI